MSEILYKGTKINYTVTGTGTKIPLVLLHGFLEDIKIWEPLVEDLKRERQIICIDLPGHGKSDGFGAVHNMNLMAMVVSEVLKTLEIKEVSIAGHSMGGYVSLEFLKIFPKMVKSVMLINSTPVEDSVEKQEIRDRSVELVGRNKNAYVSMAISNLYSKESKVKFASEIEDLKFRAMNIRAKNIQAALHGMKIRTNFLTYLKAFEKQKIIVGGKKDPILAIVDLQRLAEECGCEFYALENGHNSYMEDMNNLRKIMHFID